MSEQLPDTFGRAIGDLGPALRHLDRLKTGVLKPSPAVIQEAEDAIYRCVHRLERMKAELEEAAPEHMNALTFGDALVLLKAGQKVSRAGWNGKGMYLYLETFEDSPSTAKYEPCIVMFTAKQEHQPGWLASQADMLAEDWELRQDR